MWQQGDGFNKTRRADYHGNIARIKGIANYRNPRYCVDHTASTNCGNTSPDGPRIQHSR